MGENPKEKLDETNLNDAVHSTHEQSDDYSFIQEKIKERPINKRKLVKQSITTVSLAVVFGLVACVTFMLLEPVIGKLLVKDSSEEKNKVILPETEEEMLPENMVLDDEELIANSTENGEEAMVASVPAATTYEIQMSDYQLLYDKLYAVKDEVSKSLVSIRQTNTDTDWFLNSYQNANSNYGLIITDNGTDMYILTYASAVSGPGEIMVTFCDGVKINANFVSSDMETGYAVVSVPLSVVPESTTSSISYAKLGNSNSTGLLGDVVIAMGSPMGYEDSIGYGIITSTGNEINNVDYSYKLITTDIYGSSNATGIICNMNGQVIALVDQTHNSKDMSNLVSGVGISELKKLFVGLSNGESAPHLGLYVTNVSEEAKDMGIPLGAYVTNVKMDSPAMLNGIRKGDVIVAINDAVISSVKEYESELREQSEGDEVTVTIMRENPEGYSEYNLKVKVY